MEKLGLPLPYDMECMKMAMLKHEETFKQQVYELHRLYQIQRLLMKNMQRSMQNQETWSLKNGSISFDYQNDYNFNINKLQNQDLEHEPASTNEYEIEDESEIELTLGPTRRRNNHMNPRQLNISNSMPSFSSSSTSSSHKSRITVENSRVLSVDKQLRQVDRSLNQPPWLHRVLI
ncbi:uncharacterized protein LOC111902769 [Lactuca sativa]|uniref:Uncharacterized protein n=1 Tax=Lactuca sativa TaxID=4236 RepID=A0A9R1WGD7_LACSA|nr:uncharacterized protein LOC111902769 [Lactuca sativa]XP_023754347.1 uncharacterized protein LOC111902769 [Lactuca sativa]KAJ0223323.1 hypothetical protein LSAT_V11C200080560 [Lactuca sativa]